MYISLDPTRLPSDARSRLEISLTEEWSARLVPKVVVVLAAPLIIVGSGTWDRLGCQRRQAWSFLYSLDRAVEAIGVGDGGPADHGLDEAEAMVAAGLLLAG